MKNTARLASKIASFFLVSALVFAIGAPSALAQGNSNVSFEGRTESFVFLPETDLFQNFKEVVPGDRKEQEMGIQNNSNETVRMYLRAEAVERSAFTSDEEYQISNELIEAMGLKLYLTTADGKEKLVYSGPASGVPAGEADEVGTMEKNINLGTYLPNAAARLNAYLYIPTYLDNRYQRAASKINWIFSCIIPDEVEIPDEDPPLGPPPVSPDDPPGEEVVNPPVYVEIPDDELPLAFPKTGEDDNILWIPVALLILSSAGVIAVKCKKQKHK